MLCVLHHSCFSDNFKESNGKRNKSDCVATSDALNQQSFWETELKAGTGKTSALIITLIIFLEDPGNPFSPFCSLSMWISYYKFSHLMPPLLSSLYPDNLTILRCYVDRLDLQGMISLSLNTLFSSWVCAASLPFHSLTCLTCIFFCSNGLGTYVRFHSYLLFQYTYYTLQLIRSLMMRNLINIEHSVRNKVYKWPSTLQCHNANMETSIVCIDRWRLKTRAHIGSLFVCHIVLCHIFFSLFLFEKFS